MFTFSRPLELDSKAISESPDGDAWVFSGYASIFNSKDLGNDVVVPGAFARSLKEHGLPVLLWQHKADEPIGVITEAREDRKGLWVRGELPKHDSLVSGRVYPQIRRRGRMSIGYRAMETERRKSDNARLLKEIRLFECSFVSMPMHPEAALESITKGGAADIDTAIAALAKVIRTLERVKAAHIDDAAAHRGADSEIAKYMASMRRFSQEAREL